MLEAIHKLDLCAGKIHNRRQQETLKSIKSWLGQPSTHIVVCGEFKRGKSTLVNALIGFDVCPVDVLPKTAVPFVLHYGSNPRNSIQYFDGKVEEIDTTPEALDKLSLGTDLKLDQVRLVTVDVDSPLLQSGLVLIDTPGVNDLSKQRADVTYSFLPLADAVLLVLDATAPFTKSESDFLKDKVFPNVLDNVIFVLGKSDRLDEEDLSEALEGVKNRIRSVLTKDVDVIAVSARRAKEGDSHQLDNLKSRLLDVRDCCSDQREQLAYARLQNICFSLLGEIELRLQTLSADKGEMSTVRLQFDQKKQAITSQFEKLERYIGIYGQNSLKALVSKSLDILKENMLEEFQHQIDTLPRNIDGYVRQQVPYIAGKKLKQWVELKATEIQSFLLGLSKRVAADYAKSFAMPLELAGLPQSLVTPKVVIEKKQAAQNETQDLINNRLMPTGIGMVAGYFFLAPLLGPLGIAAGAIAGQMAAAKVQGKRTENQRNEARGIVTTQVAATIDNFQDDIFTEINAWFDKFQSILKMNFTGKIEKIQRCLLSSDSITAEELQTVRCELESVLGQLKKESSDE